MSAEEGTIGNKRGPVIELLNDDDDTAEAAKRARTDLKPNSKAVNKRLWEHFRLYKDVNKHDLAVCVIEGCGANVKIGKTHSSSKLSQHLEYRHKEVWTLYKAPEIKAKSSSVTSFLGGAPLKFQDSLLRWIVSTYQPLSTVEDVTFRALCRSLNQNVEHVSRSSLTRNIAEKAAIIKIKLVDYIKNQNFAITTDAWTSVANQSYCAYTLHFIDSDWILRTITLDCKHHQGQSKAENTVSDITSVLEDYSLDKKNLVCVVTDTEATMVKVGQ
jgi:hypothetical protein